jgi:hypothetical protein
MVTRRGHWDLVKAKSEPTRLPMLRVYDGGLWVPMTPRFHAMILDKVLGAGTGNVSGYGSKLNVLCGIGDISSQSHEPLTKHQMVTVVKTGT